MKDHYIGMNKEFRYRGEKTTRIETLSDAVFAIAIGLLLISTSPPITFYQLEHFTGDLVPFAMCIALISIIWYEHFLFFIRYGFRNSYIVFLNVLLLFIVLFYVYPLKFLAQLLTMLCMNFMTILWQGNNEELWSGFKFMMEGGTVTGLMMIYGMGAACIFLVLVLMYRYALKRANDLELNSLEKFDTRMSIRTNLLMASIPALSALFALILGETVAGRMFSGFVYFLYTPVMFIHGARVKRERKKLIERRPPEDFKA
jgi:uncharacterized membrane protein